LTISTRRVSDTPSPADAPAFDSYKLAAAIALPLPFSDKETAARPWQGKAAEFDLPGTAAAGSLHRDRERGYAGPGQQSIRCGHAVGDEPCRLDV
jgi:hypothetical protein